MESFVNPNRLQIMSDYYIAYEIQVEIIKRLLPVKSLIRFRSVSKQWKSMVDSSEFITDHVSVNQTRQRRHLLVMRKVDSENQFVSIADDDSFPQHKFSPYVPPTVKLVTDALMLDSSHGLVCLYGSHRHFKSTNLIVLWNPFIRKSVGMLLPLESVVGFGVCPTTNDPKIVKITRITSSSMDWHAEVFTLSSWSWRSVPMPYKTIQFLCNSLVIDGVVYWLAMNSTRQGLIISFDWISEEFGQVDLPEDCLASVSYVSVSKLKESLVVARCRENDARMCDVWMMKKDGDLNPLYTKLFTFSIGLSDAGSSASKVIGFTKKGEPITEHLYKDDRYYLSTTLKVYDPYSKNIDQ